MKKELGEDASELDGYEDMREEDQARISKAWEEGAGASGRLSICLCLLTDRDSR